MQVQFTHKALRDLKRLRAFIAEKNPTAAQRMSQRLIKAINALADNPKIGRHLDELPAVRELIKDDYVVRYSQTEKAVVILNIWHGKEDR